MKDLLKADFYCLSRWRTAYIILIAAAASGIFIPMLLLGVIKAAEVMLSQADSLNIPGMEGMYPMISGALENLNADTVFVQLSPLSESFGLAITAAAAFYIAQQFSGGIIRNKIIDGKKRTLIYLSLQAGASVFSIAGMAVTLLATVAGCRLFFGEFTYDFGDIAYIFGVSAGVYLAYSGIAAAAAFITQSSVISVIISIVMPVAVYSVISMLAGMMLSVPDSLFNILAVSPTMQSLLVGGIRTPGFLLCSIGFDVMWLAVSVLIGCTVFTRKDVK